MSCITEYISTSFEREYHEARAKHPALLVLTASGINFAVEVICSSTKPKGQAPSVPTKWRNGSSQVLDRPAHKL
jgi:hypothetical protein